MRSHDPGNLWREGGRSIRLGLGLVGVSIAEIGLLVAFIEASRFSHRTASDYLWLLLFGFWAAVPFMLYFVQLRTALFSSLVGIALLAITLGIYAVVFTSHSSTAALGFLVSPIYQLGVVSVGFILETIIRRRRQTRC